MHLEPCIFNERSHSISLGFFLLLMKAELAALLILDLRWDYVQVQFTCRANLRGKSINGRVIGTLKQWCQVAEHSPKNNPEKSTYTCASFAKTMQQICLCGKASQAAKSLQACKQQIRAHRGQEKPEFHQNMKNKYAVLIRSLHECHRAGFCSKSKSHV